MSKETVNRRNILKLAGLAAMAPLLPKWSEAARPVPNADAALSFKYCLNMSTIRGHKLGFIKELQTASRAGFRAVEIWMNSLQTYLTGGGTVREAKKQID